MQVRGHEISGLRGLWRLWIDTVLYLASRQCYSSLVHVFGMFLLVFFFPGSVSVWIFAWLCEWACDSMITGGHTVTLSWDVLFYWTCEDRVNQNLAEKSGFSNKATLWDAVLPWQGGLVYGLKSLPQKAVMVDAVLHWSCSLECSVDPSPYYW